MARIPILGTVTIGDDIYLELTQAMTAVNAEAEALHEASALAAWGVGTAPQ